MAYYDALIAAWNSGTQPPTGVTGTGLTGLTTANKLIAINGWTVAGSIPTTIPVTGAQIINCVIYSEFKLLSATEQSNFLTMCAIPGALIGGSAQTTHMVAGMIIDYFQTLHSGPGTIANLTALSKALPWWQATVAQGGGGLNTPVAQSDLTQNGLS